MALVWSWGWEINAPKEKYQEAGWVCETPSRVYSNYADSAQPLGGSGGGEKCLALGGNSSSIKTPPGYFSIEKGWITFYIKFDSYSSGPVYDNKYLFSLSTSSESIFLRTNIPAWPGGYSSSATEIQLIGHDGELVETLAGSYSTDVWHRVAIKIVQDGNGTCHLENIYINGTQVDSGNLSSEPMVALTSGPIESIKFDGCHLSNGGKLAIDHIFVYDDDTDDGDRELYIHGLKAYAATVDTGWTDEGGGAPSGADLHEVGDSSYLQTTSASNELQITYAQDGIFEEVMAVNQISYNQGSGNLNRLASHLVDSGASPIAGPVYTTIQTAGKFTNILLSAAAIDAGLSVPGFTTNAANNDPVLIAGRFEVDDGGN